MCLDLIFAFMWEKEAITLHQGENMLQKAHIVLTVQVVRALYSVCFEKLNAQNNLLT